MPAPKSRAVPGSGTKWIFKTPMSAMTSLPAKLVLTRIGVTIWRTPLTCAVDDVSETGPWANPKADTVENPPLAVGRPVTFAVLIVQGL